jgi:hypothetical protein
MKKSTLLIVTVGILASCNNSAVQEQAAATTFKAPVQQPNHLYLDVHDLEPGKVNFEGVAEAHKKDLATQGKYRVQFQKFWIDEAKGKVYCLSSAPNSQAVINTHKEAHGLIPSTIFPVTEGQEDGTLPDQPYFLDIHNLGPGNVTAAAVADAHKKDLAVQQKYGVHFVNYWVDEKNGQVFCLSQAADSNKVRSTHKEAHGLLPAYILKVKQGE